MKNIIQFIKTIKIKQVLTVFMVSCLLVINTACSKANAAQSRPHGIDDISRNSAMSDTYDKYDANQNYQGGMNGYNDDSRYDGDAGLAAKTKALVDTAKVNTSKGSEADNLGDYINKVTDGAKNKVEKAQRDVPRTLKNNQENAVDYVQSRSDRLQRNLSKVPGGAKRVFDEATDTAQGALNDATRAAKKNAQDVKGNFQDIS